MLRLSYRTARPHLATAAAIAAALAAAACADSASLTSPTGPTASAARNTEFNAPRHMYHVKSFYLNDASRSARPSRGTGISYHGGTVLQNGTKVVAIYWGSSIGSGPAYRRARETENQVATGHLIVR